MSVNKELVEKRNELKTTQEKLAKVFEEGRKGDGDLDLDQVKCIEGDKQAKLNEVRKMHVRLNGDPEKNVKGLGAEVEELAAVENAEKQQERWQKLAQGDGIQFPSDYSKGGEQKSFGELFTESDAYKNRPSGKNTGPEARLDVPLKTLFETSAGWAPESIRTGRLVEGVTRPIQVLDTVPMGNTNSAQVVYMQETTRTHAAAETNEGLTSTTVYPEATFELAEQTSNVRKVATSIPITDEQLEDEAQVQSYLENRLRFGLRQRYDYQLINGDGVAPNLTGILNTSGILTRDRGTDTTVDAIYRAMRRVRVEGRSMPNAVVINPEDWEDIRLAKTDSGQYIWGHPADAGPTRVWGVTVIEADAIGAGTALVGDFANQSMAFERRGIDVQIGYVDKQFAQGTQTIRADMRVAFVVWRPSGFAQVTNVA